MGGRGRWAVIGAILAGGMGAHAAAPVLPLDDPGETHRNQLRRITLSQCMPHWISARDPSPCVSVTLTAQEPVQGYSVLPDRKGGAHLLLIPLEAVSGIESALAWEGHRPNYFQYAWESREAVAKLAGRPIPREALGLAINSLYTRSQDQLHIHMACILPTVHAQLVAQADHLGARWGALVLRGTRYHALRVMGEDLRNINPFTQLALGVPGAREAMGAYTMLVAGMRFKEGPGFVLLAAKFAPGAELLLDPDCQMAPKT